MRKCRCNHPGVRPASHQVKSASATSAVVAYRSTCIAAAPSGRPSVPRVRLPGVESPPRTPVTRSAAAPASHAAGNIRDRQPGRASLKVPQRHFEGTEVPFSEMQPYGLVAAQRGAVAGRHPGRAVPERLGRTCAPYRRQLQNGASVERGAHGEADRHRGGVVKNKMAVGPGTVPARRNKAHQRRRSTHTSLNPQSSDCRWSVTPGAPEAASQWGDRAENKTLYMGTLWAKQTLALFGRNCYR